MRFCGFVLFLFGFFSLFLVFFCFEFMFTSFGIFPVIDINSIKPGNAVIEVFRYIL